MGLQDKNTTFRIVDPAVAPVYPVSPNRKKFISLGIAAGLASGFIVLLALDFFDNTLKMADSLKPLGLPLLAVIPLFKSEEEIVQERRKDRLVYSLGILYFLIILCILGMEVIGISLNDKLIG
jgi:hypothetical protein